MVPADLNLVPNALVRNVEVLTGGASAVYGSDALAGVVNFNLIDDFQGLRLNGSASIYQHNNGYKSVQALVARFEAANPGEYPLPDSNVIDGFTQSYSIVAGANIDEGRGNVTIYGSYRKATLVDSQDRDYSSCRLGAATGGQSFTCNSSPVDTPASFVNTARRACLAQFRVFNNQFVARNALVDTYNDIVGGQLQRPDERYMLGGMAHYEINEHLVPFLEFGFTNSRTRGIQSPGAVQRNGISATAGGFNCDNPFLSAQQASFLCTSRGLSTASNYDPVTGAYISPARSRRASCSTSARPRTACATSS
ncbi:MAG: TonB-dependent receptor plug domain-containing protein [Sphingomonas sp.]